MQLRLPKKMRWVIALLAAGVVACSSGLYDILKKLNVHKAVSAHPASDKSTAPVQAISQDPIAPSGAMQPLPAQHLVSH